MNDGLDSVEMAKRRYSSELAAYTLEQWNIARRAASSARATAAAAAASAGLAHVNEEEADGANGTIGVGSSGGNGGKRKDHQRERSTDNGDRFGDNSLGGGRRIRAMDFAQTA